MNIQFDTCFFLGIYIEVTIEHLYPRYIMSSVRPIDQFATIVTNIIIYIHNIDLVD